MDNYKITEIKVSELSLEELLIHKTKTQEILDKINDAISNNKNNKHSKDIIAMLKENMDLNKKNGLDVMCLVMARTNTGPINSYFENDSSKVNLINKDIIEFTGNIVNVYYDNGENRTVVSNIEKIVLNVGTVEKETVIEFITRNELNERIQEDAKKDMQGRADNFVKELKKSGIEIKDFEIKYKDTNNE